MSSAERLLKTLFDPRGRADRMEMLLAAGVVIALELALTVSGAQESVLVWSVKAVALWVGTVVSGKRLRDIGHSAWWLVAGAAGLCIWATFLSFGFLLFLGADEMAEGSPGFVAYLGLVMMPAIGVAFWLHLAEGVTAERSIGAGEAEPQADLTSARPRRV